MMYSPNPNSIPVKTTFAPGVSWPYPEASVAQMDFDVTVGPKPRVRQLIHPVRRHTGGKVLRTLASATRQCAYSVDLATVEHDRRSRAARARERDLAIQGVLNEMFPPLDLP